MFLFCPETPYVPASPLDIDRQETQGVGKIAAIQHSEQIPNPNGTTTRQTDTDPRAKALTKAKVYILTPLCCDLQVLHL